MLRYLTEREEWWITTVWGLGFENNVVNLQLEGNTTGVVKQIWDTKLGAQL